MEEGDEPEDLPRRRLADDHEVLERALERARGDCPSIDAGGAVHADRGSGNPTLARSRRRRLRMVRDRDLLPCLRPAQAEPAQWPVGRLRRPLSVARWWGREFSQHWPYRSLSRSNSRGWSQSRITT